MKCEFPIRNIFAWLGGRLSPTVVEFQSADQLNIFWAKLKIRLRRMMVQISTVKEPNQYVNYTYQWFEIYGVKQIYLDDRLPCTLLRQNGMRVWDYLFNTNGQYISISSTPGCSPLLLDIWRPERTQHILNWALYQYRVFGTIFLIQTQIKA